MRFLRRADDSTTTPETGTSVEEGGSPEQPDPRRTPGKGRPTPKRREAEARKRGPAPPPPRTQREAAKLAKANRPSKEERRRQAAERRARMDAGDERVLLPRDRGPVRAYVRDLVDSRAHVVGLFMPLAVIVLISVVLPFPAAQQYLSLFSLVALTVMIVEGLLLGRRVVKAARARFPNEEINAFAIGWYAFTRATQVRKLRVPKPRVQRGAQV